MATLEEILTREENPPHRPPGMSEEEWLFQLLLNSPTIYAEAKAEGVLSPEMIDMIEQAQQANG